VLSAPGPSSSSRRHEEPVSVACREEAADDLRAADGGVHDGEHTLLGSASRAEQEVGAAFGWRRGSNLGVWGAWRRPIVRVAAVFKMKLGWLCVRVCTPGWRHVRWTRKWIERNGTERRDGTRVASRQLNMYLARNHLHTTLNNARRALLSRRYVQPTHAGPALAASVTPVEKILLNTIKACTVQLCRIFETYRLRTSYRRMGPCPSQHICSFASPTQRRVII
jgi:hypothetical protein